MLTSWLLDAQATCKVHLRDRSTWTISCAPTLQWKLQIKLSVLASHSTLTQAELSSYWPYQCQVSAWWPLEYIFMHEYHMDICDELCLSNQPAILHGKNFNVGHYMQTVLPVLFCTCHACRHHWLLPFDTMFIDLDLALGHRVSTEQNLLASLSCTQFIWSGWNLMWWWSDSSWIPWDYFWARFIETRDIAAVLQIALKNFTVGMHLNVYEWIWFRLGLMIDTIVLYVWILVWLTLTLIEGHRIVRKQKLPWQLSHKVFN